MRGRDSLEENVGDGGINVGVNPGSPCVECFLEGDDTVHVSVELPT